MTKFGLKIRNFNCHIAKCRHFNTFAFLSSEFLINLKFSSGNNAINVPSILAKLQRITFKSSSNISKLQLSFFFKSLFYLFHVTIHSSLRQYDNCASMRDRMCLTSWNMINFFSHSRSHSPVSTSLCCKLYCSSRLSLHFVTILWDRFRAISTGLLLFIIPVRHHSLEEHFLWFDGLPANARAPLLGWRRNEMKHKKGFDGFDLHLSIMFRCIGCEACGKVSPHCEQGELNRGELSKEIKWWGFRLRLLFRSRRGQDKGCCYL